MLEVSDLHAGYGPVQVLRGVSLSVNAGEVLCLLGRNGAGKTTTLKSIMGLLPVSHGHVSMQGTVLSDMPAHKIPGEGIGYIPQGRRLFPQLSVAENIEMGLMAGGPKVLLLDEPTEGLQPSMIALIRDVILKMRDEGFAIILVEQRVDAILQIADHAVFVENGKSVRAATGAQLQAEPDLLKHYLGV